MNQRVSLSIQFSVQVQFLFIDTIGVMRKREKNEPADEVKNITPNDGDRNELNSVERKKAAALLSDLFLLISSAMPNLNTNTFVLNAAVEMR